MKTSCIIHYVLAILEAAVSGVCFYKAGQAKETRRKALLFTASGVWFACPLVSSLHGGRKLRQITHPDGGDANDRYGRHDV